MNDTGKDRKPMKSGQKVTLVAGGAGFIGSHLCRALLDRGEQVLCLDNLLTARHGNLDALEHERGFTFLRADIVDPLEGTPIKRERIFGAIVEWITGPLMNAMPLVRTPTARPCTPLPNLAASRYWMAVNLYQPVPLPWSVAQKS